MSYSKRGQIPLSPSFVPRKLGFDEHATSNHNNTFQTPRNSSTHSKENKAPPTPLSGAKDSQYKQWLQRNGFYQLFRDSALLSAVIKILRLYSQEICDKVEIVLSKNNELKQWRVEVGEPALERIKRYKLIEKEWKNEQQSMSEQYEEKNGELKAVQHELADMQNQIKDIYVPKIKEYDRLLIQFNSMQREHKNAKDECKKFKKMHCEQSTQMSEILERNKRSDEEIDAFKQNEQRFKAQIAQQV